ncbi:BNR repeat-like domain-containing protein [Cyclobacterium xiamenense]|uniref:BNR repeat-like domain-containing protein n=1 Tax=Cyclobacterium xiamenense TaxID=1297121 RepID=A0A1H6Z5V1_9BACT|nr:sialidase family protein [Cyclobacterium xiamenense]SEJ48096.1 BNR repeat-like domain-containing protein [Cyclobacterium xiamenense]
MRLPFLFALHLFVTVVAQQPSLAQTNGSTATKIRDLVIYQDSMYYASFPSIVRKADGDFLLSFRRAPDRRVVFGEKGNNHVDPNSYLVSMTSRDGLNWEEDPELLHAYDFGGSQDPCLLQLRDGTLLCTSYAWAFLRDDGVQNLPTPNFQNRPGTVFLGGYLLRSIDGGKSWSKPIYPPHIEPEVNLDPMGRPIPAYNRGALLEGKNGRIYWVVAANDQVAPRRTSNYLLVSDDQGRSWEHLSTVAKDEEVIFNEASLHETPKGDLVAFIRTDKYEGQSVIARSSDGGKTFSWQGMGFKGHPLQALRLPDDRVLLVYGYRYRPYGIRARILNPECTDFATAEEIVLREDGGSGDIGYPWAVMLDEKRALVTYYFNKDNGTRHIAGTVLEIH